MKLDVTTGEKNKNTKNKQEEEENKRVQSESGVFVLRRVAWQTSYSHYHLLRGGLGAHVENKCHQSALLDAPVVDETL